MEGTQMLAAYGVNKTLMDKGFTEDEAHELECGIIKALVPLMARQMSRLDMGELSAYIEGILSRLFNTVRTITFGPPDAQAALQEEIKRVYAQGGGVVHFCENIQIDVNRRS